MLEIEEHVFKERFDTKYLHQVSYPLDACAHHTAVYQVSGTTCVPVIMRRASEASLFLLGFPRKKKPLHDGSCEHRVPKIKKPNIILYQGCLFV